ncbi:DNA cytosine methyltransferase [Streptomyces sp. NPDC058619]|uniref:DNA cytosine methyltransferase n=1 Tax=unclassified Streptomyces TaxID=2593676 RepID=UPI0036569A68
MTSHTLGLFAGIGWAEGLNTLGLTELGLELATPACRTRAAAGHPTVQCDVAAYPTAPFTGRTNGIIASPPCPGFGKSGKGLGLLDLPLVHQAVSDLAAGHDTRTTLNGACRDPRSILTAEPMRWLHALRPAWICMEQVPSVLPVWEQYAAILRSWGYSADTAVIDAAHYGLPQNRLRAILTASRNTDARIPAPTHGGPGQPAQQVMADAIGWGYTQRPAPTVTGGGTATGGAEPFGNGTRQAMRRAHGTSLWADRGIRSLTPTIAECATLQGFRPGLPWQGGKGEQHLIVGNAVPPLLAAHIAAAAAGIPMPAALAAAA